MLPTPFSSSLSSSTTSPSSTVSSPASSTRRRHAHTTVGQPAAADNQPPLDLQQSRSLASDKTEARTVKTVSKNKKRHAARINRLTNELFKAAYMGDVDAVQQLIKKGAHVNAISISGKTVLMQAAAAGHEAVVKLLLDNGLDVNAKGPFGWTALMSAADSGHEPIAKLLVDKGADMNTRSDSSWTPLGYAAYKGHTAVVKLLLNRGANAHIQTTGNRTPLMDAAYKGHSAVVKLLLEKDADINAQATDGRTALVDATSYGHTDTVKLLLEAGANANHILIEANLNVIASRGHAEILRLLIQYGANVKTQMGEDALMNAVAHGHAQAVQVLIDGGVDVKGQLGIDAIAKAAYQGHAAVLQLLIDSGAGAADKARDRAFTNAIDQQHLEVIQVLIQDIDRMIKSEGRTGLNMGPAYFGSLYHVLCDSFKRAAETGRTAILKVLHDALIRFEFGCHGIYGQALDAAAYGGHTDAVRLLIESGISAKYPGSCRALQSAAYHGYTEIVEMLLAAGVEDYHIAPALKSAQARGHTDIVNCLMEAQKRLQASEGTSSSQVTINVANAIDPRDEALEFARKKNIQEVVECMKRIPEADRPNVLKQCRTVLMEQREPFLSMELGRLVRKLDRKQEPVVVAAAPATPQPSEFWEIERACLTGITHPPQGNHPGFTYDPEKQAAFFLMQVPLVHIPPNEQYAVCKREASFNAKAAVCAASPTKDVDPYEDVPTSNTEDDSDILRDIPGLLIT